MGSFCRSIRGTSHWREVREVQRGSICLKDDLVFLWLCSSTMQHQAIEHSQLTVWWLTTMVPEWLCCHVSATGLGVISSGPWEMSYNGYIRLVCLSLKKWMLGHSLHGERTWQHPVYTAGGGDNIVLSGYNVHIVLDWVNSGGFERPLLTTRVIFRPLLLLLHELMNYAGAIHIATPDHDSIIAPVIWTKTFSVSNLLQKAPW